ncbi:undecaprenyl-diphosphatase [Okibacterium sp. HSC-33S16]|uniref:bifunctional phosphatase PAP2/diacylglycerol kinase family protein n=1 Tax=Okibacterium sp. HSC-33S16 TaxID=2910965 RepID=UPI00209F4F85|nr:phosphatase PAP2 family protein [Okibacterium sp. HSC-33S16]MCP2030138.1 undecaprenyl-diphosphatase [Okibacterium sp. HSC-33S16]
MRLLRFPLVAVRRMALLPGWVRRVDGTAGRLINTRRASHQTDRALRRLSRAADRSVLWFVVGAALALLGQHRAALRGLASLTVASALANLVGKQLFGGDRPLTKDIPVGRRLRQAPTSPSFPSGHSASAAAFATGVALERPRIGLAIAPVAVAVSYSRLHTGAHWLSDVLGGAAIGAGVAAFGKAVIPAPPQKPARHGGTPISLPAAVGGAGLLVIANSSSGADVIGRDDPLPLIRERMPQARVHTLTDDETPSDVVAAALAAAQPPRMLGVCGGDGTVTAMAQCARDASLPLVVVPGGTFNHFARALGIESAGDALDAVTSGQGVRVDTAELRLDDNEPKLVLNAASIGIYPTFVAEREKLEATLGKWIGGIAAATRVLRSADPIDIEIDGVRRAVWSVFAGVNRNVPGVPAPLRRQRLDDGQLDIRILTARSRLHAIASLSFGRKTSAVLRAVGLIPRTGVESFTVPSLEVTVWRRQGQPAGFAHDGEVEQVEADAPAGPYPSTVTLVPQSLDVYAPDTRSR